SALCSSDLTVSGSGEPLRELIIPYRDQQLRGEALSRQLDAWIAGGFIEPSCADSIRTVAAHPEWLSLPGQTVIVLGAGAEVGPLSALLGWGVNVIGVDLPNAALWQRGLEVASRGAGTLTIPVMGGPSPAQASSPPSADRTESAN